MYNSEDTMSCPMLGSKSPMASTLPLLLFVRFGNCGLALSNGQREDFQVTVEIKYKRVC